MTRDLALRLLKEPTARDKQTFIGASSFGSPCGACLVDELARTKGNTPNRWWLGAVIGTAIHGLLEEREASMLDPDDVIVEEKIYLGELEDYGVISSKPDLYIKSEKRTVDWKTTSRKKMTFLKEAWNVDPSPMELSSVSDARFKLAMYQNQLLSYGRGLVMAGHEVEVLSLVFINRDGLTDDDVWGVDFPYDQEKADAVWDRLVRAWDYVREGKDRLAVNPHPNCTSCAMRERS